MDERVFGPYYGTPTEQQTPTSPAPPSEAETLRPSRTSLRARLLARRKRRPTTHS